MKTVFPIFVLAWGCVSGAQAQDRIYRCGNEYTNTVTESQAKNYKLISGGNVTVVQSNKPNTARAAAASQPGQRVDAGDQRAKDSDSRLILESELRRPRHARPSC